MNADWKVKSSCSEVLTDQKRQDGTNRWMHQVLFAHGLQEVQWELPLRFYMYVVLWECVFSNQLCVPCPGSISSDGVCATSCPDTSWTK